jgi:hypothetical protein
VAHIEYEQAIVLARAVDGDDHAAGIGRTIGCQEDRHVGYFAWFGGAPEREVFHQFAVAVFTLGLLPFGPLCLRLSRAFRLIAVTDSSPPRLIADLLHKVDLEGLRLFWVTNDRFAESAPCPLLTR